MAFGPLMISERFAIGGGAGAFGVIALEGTDAGLSPITLVARTINVYGVPFVRPFTTTLVSGACTTMLLPVEIPEVSVITV